MTSPATPATPAEPRTLLSEADIAARVHDLGARIAADHPDGVVLVGVLKGALLFLADLARAIEGVDVLVDFIAISRYAPDSGRVRILHDVATDLEGRDVIVVEDIVDTGLTLGYLLGHLQTRARGRWRCAHCSTGRCGASCRARCATSARRSPMCSCSGTGSTAPIGTATWHASSRLIVRSCWRTPPRI